MKTLLCVPRWLILHQAAWLLVVLAHFQPLSVNAAYRAGDIVTNNFTLQNRFQWTNDNGQIFTPSNTFIRLSDFDGKIVFFCFFDVW